MTLKTYNKQRQIDSFLRTFFKSLSTLKTKADLMTIVSLHCQSTTRKRA
jgi:hypothetical protein